MKRPKLQKIRCEIEGCGVTEKAALHLHHIVERKVIGTSNDPMNLAILCANHHELTHDGKKLEIIGVYPSTGEQGRTLVYKLNGVPNIPDINEPYFKNQPKAMRIVEKDENQKSIK